MRPLCPESPPLRACLRGAGPSLLANTRVSTQLTPEAPGANGVRCGHHSENSTSSRQSATARDQEGRHGLSLHPFPFVSFKKNKHTHEQPARPCRRPEPAPAPLIWPDRSPLMSARQLRLMAAPLVLRANSGEDYQPKGPSSAGRPGALGAPMHLRGHRIKCGKAGSAAGGEAAGVGFSSSGGDGIHKTLTFC